MAPPKAHVCILVAAAILYGTTARAHHSFGTEYDAQRPVTVTGVVTKIRGGARRGAAAQRGAAYLG
jgi:hypothetical protein